MAVTKIWDIKGRLDAPLDYVANKDKTENPKYSQSALEALADVIDYAANEDKTEQHFFVSAINCNTTCARRQFMTIKKQFDKDDGILAYHAYQSFAPGETTPDTAHEIGMKLAKELWGDRFQIVVATHLNTNCLHNHFVINSVSFKDGKKYHDCKETYQLLRKTSDRICREYGLSVVERPASKGISHNLYKAEQSGIPTRYNVAKAAIDEAISKSCNMREFAIHLKSSGYTMQLNPNRKYWTINLPGWSRPIRMARLGENYTNERIKERVFENPMSVRFAVFQSGKKKSNKYLLLTRRDHIWKIKGLKGLYLRYCYELGYLPRYKQSPQKVSPLLRDDIYKCEMFSQQVRLISNAGIETKSDVTNFIQEKENLMKELTEKREELRRKQRRRIPYEEKLKVKSQITELTSLLNKTRKELKLAKDIELRVDNINEKLLATDREMEQEVRSG